MEQDDKIRRLLDMHEHPENYTDEQLAALLDDEPLATLQEHLSTAKRAMIDVPDPDVDAEWQRFEQQHFVPVKNRRWLKVAAMFIGVLMLSAFTYAAIRAVSVHRPGDSQEAVIEPEAAGGALAEDDEAIRELPDTIGASDQQPITYDNVAFSTIIDGIATRYHTQVDFRNEEVRDLRFYFELHTGEDLNNVIDRLNMFERVSVSIEGNTIVVE